ncbi:MAG: TIGR00297 family protein [Haloarcula sp.]
MTGTVRRAGAFAAVGTLAVAVPAATGFRSLELATVAAIAPFVLVAALGVTVIGQDSRLFDLFARPGDYEDGKLYGLAAFSLAAAGLALLAVRFNLPAPVFVGVVAIVAYGNFGQRVAYTIRSDEVVATAGFIIVGFVAGVAGQVLGTWIQTTVGNGGPTPIDLPLVLFLAASGAFVAALLRSVLFERDDPLVMLTVGLLLWLFFELDPSVTTRRVVIALAVTVLLGYLSYALDTASLPGMLTGVLLSFLTIVLGGFGWFAMLISFFALGGLSTKFRYDKKLDRGIAEENEGARGSGNVLANSIVALFAVVAAAASPSHIAVNPLLFFYAFAGAVAAAMTDTFSSEFGGLYDNPRLITTLKPVEPGTDGGVTWQGVAAGAVGAGIIAGIAALTQDIGTLGSGVILLCGLIGMTVDSLLGATVEGSVIGNQGVNMLATLAAALTGAGVVLSLGLL